MKAVSFATRFVIIVPLDMENSNSIVVSSVDDRIAKVAELLPFEILTCAQLLVCAALELVQTNGAVCLRT